MSRSSSTSTVGSANTADATTSACSTSTDATATTTATTTTSTTIGSTTTTNTSTSTDTTSNSRNSTTAPITSSNSTGSISSSAAGVRRVGKYEVGRTLGEGTFAKVKYAINTETGESVALKVLDKDKILQHKMVDQIKREISIMKLVRHPNIVRLHEVLASRTKIYIVLEFVTGGELFDRIVHLGRIGEEESRRYFQQLIDAVEFCHSKGVYHRDLKPENLLLDTRGNLKISDFGLSALPQQVRDDGLLHTTCGTPNYVAPEVLSDKGYDGAMSDLWSCGVILFVLLAGFLPFDEPDLATLYRKIQKAEYRCPPWFSQGVARLIARILDPNPKTRYRYADIRKDEWFQQGYVPVRPLQDSALNLDDIDAVFAGTEGHEIADSKQLTRGQGGATAPFGAATPSSPGGAAARSGGGTLRPETMNAFELITLSRGLDLGVLFERRPDMVQRHTRFASRCPAEDIVFHVERAAKELRCVVTVKNFKMRLESREPRVGGGAPLAVAVQVFLVAPGLFMVEVWKVSGNLLDFHKFYRRLYALVKDVVWKSEADLDDLRLKHTKVQPPSSSSSFSSLPSASSTSAAAAAAARSSRPTSPFTPRQHAATPKSPTSPAAASTASASVTAATVTAAVTAAAAAAAASTASSAASDLNHPRRLLKSPSSSSAASVLRVRMRKLPSFVKL